MLVYATHKGGNYLPFADSLKLDNSALRTLYINLTNRCDCACVFCLRGKKAMAAHASLWLKKEPTVEELKTALEGAPWRVVKDVVFCGFGEPTQRLDVLIELLRTVKERYPEHATRLNTNGLGELANGRIFAQDFAGILDTVSISLNATNAADYYKLTKAKYGEKSYDAMLAFAEHCKPYVPNVVLTVVDKVQSPAEIEEARKICEDRGFKLRVRTYEAS